MVYLIDDVVSYTDIQYDAHFKEIPEWRKEKTLRFRKMEDRKLSVLTFVLLKHALFWEYGITDVPEFSYGFFGKPYWKESDIYFNLSHCKDAVACALSDHEIGIDVESIVPYNPKVSKRICSPSEYEHLIESEDKDVDLIHLWTSKEAVSKWAGKGLALMFSEITLDNYLIDSRLSENGECICSICEGLKSQKQKLNEKVMTISVSSL